MSNRKSTLMLKLIDTQVMWVVVVFRPVLMKIVAGSRLSMKAILVACIILVALGVLTVRDLSVGSVKMSRVAIIEE